MGDGLGGHIVTGHVDGLAEITAITPEGDSQRYTFKTKSALMPFIAPKGSVTLDGTSLTVNEVDGLTFGVNLIPHTQEVLPLGPFKSGRYRQLKLTFWRAMSRVSNKQKKNLRHIMGSSASIFPRRKSVLTRATAR